MILRFTAFRQMREYKMFNSSQNSDFFLLRWNYVTYQFLNCACISMDLTVLYWIIILLIRTYIRMFAIHTGDAYYDVIDLDLVEIELSNSEHRNLISVYLWNEIFKKNKMRWLETKTCCFCVNDLKLAGILIAAFSLFSLGRSIFKANNYEIVLWGMWKTIIFLLFLVCKI